MCKEDGCPRPEVRNRHGYCMTCYKRDYRRRNPAKPRPKSEEQKGKDREAGRRWRENNPEAAKASHKKYREAHPGRHKAFWRRSHLKRLYGITPEQVEALWEAQGRACALCAGPVAVFTGLQTAEAGVVDHCHSTGKVRGILHARCNVGLGAFGDDPTRLEAAARYLRLHASLQHGEPDPKR